MCRTEGHAPGHQHLSSRRPIGYPSSVRSVLHCQSMPFLLATYRATKQKHKTHQSETMYIGLIIDLHACKFASSHAGSVLFCDQIPCRLLFIWSAIRSFGKQLQLWVLSGMKKVVNISTAVSTAAAAIWRYSSRRIRNKERRHLCQGGSHGECGAVPER